MPKLNTAVATALAGADVDLDVLVAAAKKPGPAKFLKKMAPAFLGAMRSCVSC